MQVSTWPSNITFHRWLFPVADGSKIFKSRIKACQVNAGVYMAFKYHISLAITLAANLVVIDAESS